MANGYQWGSADWSTNQNAGGTGLTQEQLRAILQDPNYRDADGYAYQAVYADPGSYQGMDSYTGGGGPTSIRKYKPIANAKQGDSAKLNGTLYDEYDLSGKHIGQNTWHDLGDGIKWQQGLGAIALAALGGYGLSQMGGAAGLDAAATAGMDGAAFGDAGMMYAGADAGAAATLGGGGSLSTVAPLAGAAGAGGAAAGMGGGAAAGGGGLLGGLGAGASSLLGPAAAAIGGIAGAQGQEGQTSERKMDPRLDQYVYGQNGLIPGVHGLLQRQNPIALQTGDYMRNFGQGLLGRGVAANPFTGK
jgi:hypothetical protein